MKTAIVMKPRLLMLALIAILSFAISMFAQAPRATPPPPTAPRTVQFPKPVERTLPNGLRVVVIQRSEMPLVSAQLLIKSGGGVDPAPGACARDTNGALLTKGATARSATPASRGDATTGR